MAKKVKCQPQQQQQQQQQAVEKIVSFGAVLKVKTEELDGREQIFPSFSFSTPESVMVDNFFAESMIENSLMGGFSPSFLSPATSESNYFSLSPCGQMNSFGQGQSLYTAESDSTPTSVTNSPIGACSFSLDLVDFDPNFPFDSSEYFQ